MVIIHNYTNKPFVFNLYASSIYDESCWDAYGKGYNVNIGDHILIKHKKSKNTERYIIKKIEYDINQDGVWGADIKLYKRTEEQIVNDEKNICNDNWNDI